MLDKLDRINYKRYFLIFICIGFIIFANILGNGFVWIDTTHILNNPEGHQLSLHSLLEGSSLTATGYYRPVAALYLATIYHFFADNPFFYHIFQIFLASTNAFLLYVFFTLFVKKRIAFVLALVYLIHPMREAAVAYISATADLLYIFFGLSALILSTKVSHKSWQVFLMAIFLLLSLLSKESGIFFFFAIFLFIWLIKRKNILFYGILEVVTFIVYLAIRFHFNGFYLESIDYYPLAQLNLFERLINIPTILYYYLSKFIIPLDLGGSHIWVIRTATLQNFYLPLVVELLFFSVLVYLAFFIYKRHREQSQKFIFFLIIFWLGLSIYTQIIPLDFTVSARWFNVSMMGLLGMIGVLVNTLHIKKKSLIYIAFVITLVYLSFLVFRTVVRNQYWKNDITLFTRFAEVDDNFVIEHWLANAYLVRDNYHEALFHEQKSVEMFPYDHNLLWEAFIYEKLGNLPKAQEYYFKSLYADNYAAGYHDDTTYRGLLRFFLLSGNTVEATKLLRQAVQDHPKEGYFWELLAVEEYKLGNPDQALYAAQIALELMPNDKNARYVLTQIQNRQSIDLQLAP